MMVTPFIFLSLHFVISFIMLILESVLLKTHFMCLIVGLEHNVNFCMWKQDNVTMLKMVYFMKSVCSLALQNSSQFTQQYSASMYDCIIKWLSDSNVYLSVMLYLYRYWLYVLLELIIHYIYYGKIT